MRRHVLTGGLALLLMGHAALPVSSMGQSRSLTGLATLTRAYDAILALDSAAARRELDACRDAPAPACVVLDATRLWWEIQLDPHSRGRDATFIRRADEAIALTHGWTEREPERAEAWFYLGAAYGVRVQWRVLRGERLAAARDGKRIKTALETALALDPTLADANFGIGLYQYYAAVAPAAARFLRWLLLLPGGDRTEGLARLLKARDEGLLIGDEADYQLHVIYLWYEQQFPKALALLMDLAERHKQSPIFPILIADVYDKYFHDPTSTARTLERLLELAQEKRVNEPVTAAIWARLGLAAHLETLYESDRALEHAQAVLAAKPAAPYSSMAEAWLQAGRASLHLGATADAQHAFTQAMALVPGDDPLQIRARVTAARQVRVAPQDAEAYRLALEGWRHHERGMPHAADRALARATTLAPDDMVTRYRYGVVLRARGDDAGAERQWTRVFSTGSTTPPFAYAEACAALAALVEQRGDRPRALLLYRRAAQTFGAFAATRAAAEHAAARLQQRLER